LIIGAVGVGGYVVWQLFWTFILPLLGVVLGFVWMAVKIGLLVGLAYWIYRMLMKGAAKKAEPEA